ncbi:MAG: amidohydrolase family protein, partial [Dethiobacter sp.]|nr:amidohydrolase family protein [Dethiobacter sp.]
ETFTPAVMGKMNLAYTDLEFASGPYAGKTCTEELFLQQRSEAPGTLVIAYIMNEVEVRQAMVHPDVLPASDAILSNGMGHPRSSGTFPRFISKYVREECSISLMEALRKMTSYPAARLNLSERGNLEAGTYADIVIFDYEKIRDTSSYQNCISSPEGISSLIVGGEIVLSEGELAGSTPGEAVFAR